jgi:MFS family permease
MTLRPIWIVAAVCLLAMMSTIGVSMPYPILAPIFVGGPVDRFTHFAGIDPQVLMGIALAANPLGILVGSLFVGPLSDRYGRRAMLTLTISGSLLSYLLTAAALAARQYPLFVLMRFVTGLTEGNVAVARALLADLDMQPPSTPSIGARSSRSSEEGPAPVPLPSPARARALDRTRSFAWLNSCVYVGWLLGPLVGGLTLPFGEAVPFLLAAAMMLPCLVVLARGLPRPAATARGPLHLRQALREQSVIGLLRSDPTLAWVASLQLAYTLGLNALYEYAPLWMVENAGLDSRGIALVTAAQCAVMTLSSVIAGRFGLGPAGSHPLRRASLVALGGAFGLALLAVLPGRAGLAAIVLMGLPASLYNAVLPAWVSERFASHGQGRVMGLLSTMFCVANVIVALAGGWIALLSTRWIMGLGGAACIAAALLTLRLARTEARAAPARAHAVLTSAP